jgi:hypothetical protein
MLGAVTFSTSRSWVAFRIDADWRHAQRGGTSRRVPPFAIFTIPIKVAVNEKGKTSHHMLQDHRRLRKEFWGRHLWARGYFVATTGTVTDEAVAQYIEKQDAETEDDEFKITQ